jgi:tetratricopeptide (TPR) repeat protein
MASSRFTQERTLAVFDLAARTQPFPVAYFARRVVATATLNLEDEGAIRTALDACKLAFYHLTRTYGLMATCHYLQDPGFLSPRLSAKVSEMRMPFDSTWKEFLVHFADIYGKPGRENPFPELGALGEESFRSALKDVVQIRNRVLGHNNVHLAVEALYGQYLAYRDAIAYCFSQLAFLDGRRLALVAVLAWREDPGDTELQFLHGADAGSVEARIGLLRDYDRNDQLRGSRLAVLDPSTGWVLPLDPFCDFLDHDDRSGPEDHLLFSGLGHRDALYSSTRTEHRNPGKFHLVRQAMADKKVELIMDLAKYRWEMLLGFSRDATGMAFARYYNDKKYFQDRYVARREMEAELRGFLASERTAMVITGRSGIGKSALVARLAHQFLELDAGAWADSALFLVNAADLPGGTLLQAVLATLCLRGEAASFKAFLARVKEMLLNTGTGPGQVVLVIDAVNEAQDTLTLWKEIDALVMEAADASGNLRFPWLKVVVTIRDTGLSVLHQGLQGEARTLAARREAGLMGMPQLYWTGPEDVSSADGTVPSPLRTLHPFTDEELGEALEKYLGTRYLLGPGTRHILANPFYLKMVSTLPDLTPERLAGLSALRLLELRLDELAGGDDLTSGKVRKLLGLVARRLAEGSVLTLGEAADFRHEEGHQALGAGLIRYTSAVDLLQSEGLLSLQGEGLMPADQKVRELLLSRHLEPGLPAAPLAVDALAALFKQAEPPAEQTGALAWLLLKRLELGRLEELTALWGRTAGAQSPCADPWEMLYRFECFEQGRGLDLIGGLTASLREGGVALRGLGNLLNQLAGELYHLGPEQAILLYEAALAIGGDLAADDPGNGLLVRSHAICSQNLGGLLRHRGPEGLARAVRLRTRAMERLRGLHEADPEAMVEARDYALACHALAAILHDLGPEEQVRAAALYEIAIGILKDLVLRHPEDDDLAESLAIFCDGLAVFLNERGADGLTRALVLYNDALEGFRRLHEGHPDRRRFAQGYAQVCRNLAAVERRREMEPFPGHARGLQDTSLGILKRLHQSHPDRIDLAFDYGRSCEGCAGLHAREGTEGAARAEGFYQEALDTFQRLLTAHPERVDFGDGLARAGNAFAIFLWRLGGEGIERGRRMFEQVLAILEELHQAHPDRLNLTNGYITTSSNYAFLLGGVGGEAVEPALLRFSSVMRVSRETLGTHPERTDVFRIHLLIANAYANLLPVHEAAALLSATLETVQGLRSSRPDREDLGLAEGGLRLRLSELAPATGGQPR